VFDAALISIHGTVTSKALNDAIPGSAEIDSPRGGWQRNVTTHARIRNDVREWATRR
jgi:hypothetical protein